MVRERDPEPELCSGETSGSTLPFSLSLELFSAFFPITPDSTANVIDHSSVGLCSSSPISVTPNPLTDDQQSSNILKVSDDLSLSTSHNYSVCSRVTMADILKEVHFFHADTRASTQRTPCTFRWKSTSRLTNLEDFHEDL